MPGDGAHAWLVWIILPVMSALFAALAAIMHYGVAVRRQVKDLPNLVSAVIGGACSGFLAALLALAWSQWVAAKDFHAFGFGILIASLGGEYFGGRTDDVFAAVRAGSIAAVILLPLAVGLVAWIH